MLHGAEGERASFHTDQTGQDSKAVERDYPFTHSNTSAHSPAILIWVGVTLSQLHRIAFLTHFSSGRTAFPDTGNVFITGNSSVDNEGKQNQMVASVSLEMYINCCHCCKKRLTVMGHLNKWET